MYGANGLVNFPFCFFHCFSILSRIQHVYACTFQLLGVFSKTLQVEKTCDEEFSTRIPEGFATNKYFIGE